MRVDILTRACALLAAGLWGGLVLCEGAVGGGFRYAVERLESGEVLQRGVTGAAGVAPAGLILAPETAYRYWLLEEATGLLGFSDFRTPSAGLTFSIPSVALGVPLAGDTDGDGLTDDAEFIVGTDPLMGDSDGDGILDGAAVLLGLDAGSSRTGVIGSAGSGGGMAMDVCAVDELAILAADTAGVVVFNVFNRMNPVRIAQVDTGGNALRVACSGRLVAVADGDAGLAVVDITDPPAAVLLHEISLGGMAVAVAASGGMGYVGLANGQVVAVDLASGSVLGRLLFTRPVHDLVVERDTLYVLLENELVAASLAEEGYGVLGRVGGLSFFAEGITQRRRLFVGGGLAYISSYPGYDTFDVREPGSMARVGAALDRGPNSFKQIVLNGSGFGVAAVGVNPRQDGTHDLYLYDVTNPAVTSAFLLALPTPGVTRAVALFNGLAYAADSEAGLQVVNYLAADRAGVPPAVLLDANFDLLEPAVESGEVVRVTALVEDDVQVRSVELYVDDVRLVTDGNYPFEFRFRAPAYGARDRFTVRARVSDTGGNATMSGSLEVRVLPDSTPPRVTRTIPAAGGIVGSVRVLAVFFNESIEPSTLGGETFRWRSAGVDGVLGSGDDVLQEGGEWEYRDDLRGVLVSLATELEPGLYEAEVLPPLSDTAGNAVESAFRWRFTVIGGEDSDQDGVPDNVELVLGTNMENPDTDGDGISDGFEDMDGDGLVNAGEVLVGSDPLVADTDGDGVRDGEEDSDQDGLTDGGELARGTLPLLADSDGDGWPDEAEVTAGSNPLDAVSRPRVVLGGGPPVQLVSPGWSVGAVDLPISVVLAAPALTVVVPRCEEEGSVLNTVAAGPPVQVVLPGRGVGVEEFSLNVVLGMPAVTVVVPRLEETGQEIGVVLASPPLQVVVPVSGGGGDAVSAGPVLASPPVSVDFANP